MKPSASRRKRERTKAAGVVFLHPLKEKGARVVGSFRVGNSALVPVSARFMHIAGTKRGNPTRLHLDLLRKNLKAEEVGQIANQLTASPKQWVKVMKVKISKTRNVTNDIEYIRLENRFCRVTILPELGAKISELFDKPSARNYLWQNPRIGHSKAVFGLSYFLYDCSGWDECFPAMEPIDDFFATIPEHGEVWALPWNYEILKEPRGITIHCWVMCRIMPLRMDKWITLKTDERNISVKYDIENLSQQPLRFQWVIHPMLNFEPGMRLDIPTEQVTGYISKKKLNVTDKRYKWPMDLNTFFDEETPDAFLVYSDPLSEGWWALTDIGSRNGVGMVFPSTLFNYIWVWANYGGWGSYRHIAIEPATDPPGRNSSISPRQLLIPNRKFECSLTVVFYSGVSHVFRITSDGNVIGE